MRVEWCRRKRLASLPRAGLNNQNRIVCAPNADSPPRHRRRGLRQANSMYCCDFTPEKVPRTRQERAGVDFGSHALAAVIAALPPAADANTMG